MYHANGMTSRARAFLASQKPKRVTEAQVNAAMDQIDDIWLVPVDRLPSHPVGLDEPDERVVVRRMLEAAANA